MMAPDDAATERVVEWLVANVGGRVTHIERQPRWRPVWFADVERDGETLELCVRGDRIDMPLIFPLDHEMRFQSVLYDQGIVVPKVYGWIDDPCAYVMDRVDGEPDFAKSTEAERRSVIDDYLSILARMHSLDLQPFLDAGILRAERPADSALLGMARYEAVYRSTKVHPEPFVEFVLAWIRRHPVDTKGREAPIVWDSGQFHQRDGRINAVLDVELGHIGDPMMDLAAWRMRDTIIGYGDFAELYARYEELRGEPIDLEAIQLHHIAFTLSNQLAFGAALRDPQPESDYMTNRQWCDETNLFTTEALAEYLGIDLPTVDVPAARDSRVANAEEHLVRSLRSIDSDVEYIRYKIRIAFRLARYLQRVDEIGAELEAANLDDLADLLGHRPAGWREGEAELEQFVLADADTGRYDVELVTLFHKRNLRAHMQLGPAGSAMTRHLPIQTFR
jgi:aminoglycoside phosphotransferase (APT) family kinase protein